MATREELLSLFGDDFDEVLKGLNALPVEVRQLLDTSLNNLVYDAEVFGQRINKVVQTQQARGIALSNIAGSLATDMQNKGRIFGELKNSIKSSLVEGVNQAGQAGSFAAYDPDENTVFTWITVAGHKICADCAPRGGQQGTLREWEERGMPGTGWSVCQGYCYCILDPSGKLSPRIQFEEVQEQGATARPTPTPPAAPLPTPPPIPKEIKWKPEMTLDEATEWSKGSKLEGIHLHGTTKEGAAGIRKNGFDFEKSRSGKLYSNGAYTTKTEKVAKIYAGDGGTTIKTMIKSDKVFEIDAENFKSYLVKGYVPRDFDSKKFVLNYDSDKHLNLSSGKKALAKKYWDKNNQNIYFNPNKPKPTFDEWYVEKFSLGLPKRAQLVDLVTDAQKADLKKALDMSDRWYNFLENEINNGNEIIKRWVERDRFISNNAPEFPDAFRKFLISEGYDAIKVNKAFLQAADEIIYDDYIISLFEENIVSIID